MACHGPMGREKETVPASDFMWSWPTALQHVCGAPSWLQSFEKVSSFIFLETEDLCPPCRGLLGSSPYHRPGLDWFHDNSPCGPQPDDSGGDWPLVLHAHRLFNDECDVRDWSVSLQQNQNHKEETQTQTTAAAEKGPECV